MAGTPSPWLEQTGRSGDSHHWQGNGQPEDASPDITQHSAYPGGTAPADSERADNITQERAPAEDGTTDKDATVSADDFTVPKASNNREASAGTSVIESTPIGATEFEVVNVDATEGSSSATSMAGTIVVFGDTGVGKSSIVNMIAGEEIAKVCGGAAGMFFEESHPIDFEGRQANIIEVPAINQDDKKPLSSKEAIAKLRELLDKVQDSHVIVLYCIRGPRVKENIQTLYDRFRRMVRHEDVYDILVVTGLENEVSMDQWWEENRATFNQYKMEFHDHACITGIKGIRDIYRQEYDESRVKLSAAIRKGFQEGGVATLKKGFVRSMLKWLVAQTGWKREDEESSPAPKHLPVSDTEAYEDQGGPTLK